MDLETFWALAGALFLFSAAPGPCVMALTARSLSGTLPAALSMAVGMLLGDLFYATAALLGVKAVGQALGEFFFLLRIVGAGYLFWLGIRLWFARPTPAQDLPRVKDRSRFRDLAAGLFICLGNPKVILFYAGFLPAFMDLTCLSPVDDLLVIATVALVVSTVLVGNAVLASRAGKWFSNRRAVCLLNRGSGAVLVGAGVAIMSSE